MVATLVRLRFLLLGNALRRSPWQIVAIVLGALYGLGLLVVCIGGLIALSWAPLELARTDDAHDELLWSRLMAIAAEDVGMGTPEAASGVGCCERR